MDEYDHCLRCQRQGWKAAKRSKSTVGDVQHETWLEYHDRLVREYYDVEAEWALIKEICPELDRPEPRQEDPVFGPLARGTVAAAKGLAVSGLIFGLIAWWVWLMVGWFS